MSLTTAPAPPPRASAPLRPVRLGKFDAVLERAQSGVIHIRTTQVLPPYHPNLSEPLEHWANAAPDRIFLAQRDAKDRWRTLSYAEVLGSAKRIGAALLRRGLSAERPIAIVSGNDIEHALLALAAMYVGIPYAPISPAYSLLSSDFGKLRAIINLLTPGMVLADDGGPFARALYQTVPDDIELVVTRNPLGDRPTTLFADLLGAEDWGASPPRTHGSRPTRSPNFCSPPVRPAIAQSRHQHPAHDVFEPGDDRRRLRLHRRRASSGGGLAAVEPHLRQ